MFSLISVSLLLPVATASSDTNLSQEVDVPNQTNAEPACEPCSGGDSNGCRSVKRPKYCPVYRHSWGCPAGHWCYNSDYLFGLSRGVAGSDVAPLLRPLCFLFTLPLDLGLLPIAAVSGLL